MTLLLLSGQRGGRYEKCDRCEQDAADDAEGTKNHFEAVAGAGLEGDRSGERTESTVT